MYLQYVLLLDRFRFYQLLTWYNKFIQQQGFMCAPKDQRAVFINIDPGMKLLVVTYGYDLSRGSDSHSTKQLIPKTVSSQKPVSINRTSVLMCD